VAKHPPNRQTKTAKHLPETINYQCDNSGKAFTVKKGGKASASEKRRQSIRQTTTHAIRMRWTQ